MKAARGCFVSINVSDIPAVAPRHLLSQVEETSPQAVAAFAIADVCKNDPAALERLARSLLRDPPGLLAASAFVWSIDHLHALARKVRKRSPETVIVIGGPAAGTYHDLYPDCVDIAALGEGEALFADVVTRFAEHGRRGLTEAPYWRKRVDTRHAWPVDFARRARLVPSGYRYEQGMAYVETSRGCPFRCAFCESALNPVRYLPLHLVEEDVVFFRNRGVTLIYFVDPSFLLRFDRAMKILRLCAGLGMRAEMEVNLDVLCDSQIRELLGVPGLIISLGIQTWNAEVLARARRRTNFEQLDRNLAFLRAVRSRGGKVDFYPHLIFGLPGDNLESFRSSVDRTLDYRPSSIFLSHLQILPRTGYGQAAGDLGLTYDSRPPFLIRSAPGFDADEIQAARVWSDPLASWDNTFGLDSLYTLADTFALSVPDAYGVVRRACEGAGLMISTHDVLYFRPGAEDTFALEFESSGEGALSVADFLRHCRLRFMKTPQFSRPHASGEPPGLRASCGLIFSKTTRLAFVDHAYSPGGPREMKRLGETMACIAHGTRIWKLPLVRFHRLFVGGSLNRVHEYRVSRAAFHDAADSGAVQSLCEDMLQRGALIACDDGS